MIKDVRYVTTVEDVTYSSEQQEKPKIWQVEVKATPLNSNLTLGSLYASHAQVFHIEEATLVKHGLVPKCVRGLMSKEHATETVESLVLQLLEKVGVYPVEESV